eukprot:TRINITY_DN16502_c0_g1_i1.p1 TRINITY_DN16502_c0_g1~~TRINITY_DN16502_c0_g1_i1.p1  ORF type:complete len:642 (-),score=135.01 TRINITY_DN16502_c0_g1_i1:184-2109(-)
MACSLREDLATVLSSQGYRELRQIGEGSFAKALLVQDASGAQAVCKVMDITEASQKEADDAAKEGKLLASLQHPYVVRYRDSFCQAGKLCIVMDFCEGGELAKHIRKTKRLRQRIPETQVLKWFTQAMLSLKYIHDKKILHRDLKPANFFLTKSGALRMGDFGIAKAMACTMACAKTRIGTPYYLAPEVCQEKPYAWPADIWAMGCVLYEMCALQVPFEAKSISGLVQKICHGELPEVPDCYSEFLQTLFRQMLDRDPRKRPSADEVLQQPQIQAIVRQMLEEVKCAQRQDSESRACAAKAAGTWRKDSLVEYHSVTHGEWLPATVVDVDDEGRIMIDLRPKVWLTLDVQAARVRPRAGAGDNTDTASNEEERPAESGSAAVADASRDSPVKDLPRLLTGSRQLRQQRSLASEKADKVAAAKPEPARISPEDSSRLPPHAVPQAAASCKHQEGAEGGAGSQGSGGSKKRMPSPRAASAPRSQKAADPLDRLLSQAVRNPAQGLGWRSPSVGSLDRRSGLPPTQGPALNASGVRRSPSLAALAGRAGASQAPQQVSRPPVTLAALDPPHHANGYTSAGGSRPPSADSKSSRAQTPPTRPGSAETQGSGLPGNGIIPEGARRRVALPRLAAACAAGRAIVKSR